MQLTKQQITFIDNYLKEKGVKYWDIRLEMIDHEATKVEENNELELNEEFLKKQFGPYYQINKMVNEKIRHINKKYRKQYLKNISYLFRSPKNIAIFLLFFYIYFKSYQLLNYKSFKIISTAFLFAPVLTFLFFYLKDSFHLKKSIHLEYANFYMSFAFIFSNLLVQFTNPTGIFETPPQIQPIVLLVTIPFYLIFTYSGYKVYRKTQKVYSKIYNEYRKVCS